MNSSCDSVPNRQKPIAYLHERFSTYESQIGSSFLRLT